MMRDQIIKQDGDKLRMELIPTSTLISLGRVLTYGAEKYEAESWRKVEPERYVGALLRHIVEYMKDPKSRDEESGLLHIEHVLCNAAFLNDFNTQEEITENECTDDDCDDPDIVALFHFLRKLPFASAVEFSRACGIDPRDLAHPRWNGPPTDTSDRNSTP